MKNQELFNVLKRLQLNVEKNLYAYLVPEHILASLLEEPRFHEIATFCKADENDIRKIISDVIESQEKVSNPVDVVPSPDYTKTIKACSFFAETRSYEIRVEHILLALLGNGEESVAYYALVKNNITKENIERFIEEEDNHEDLKYATNLNGLAAQGKFDTLIGREQEIQRVIQILHKKRASNVILCSNPGVGKTALVEGLATKIVKGEVPETLRNACIWSLDLGSMVAGTKLRGEFEERLKSTIDSVLKNENTILFIDEIHNIVSAGSAEGALDASNILKPYLTDNRFRCIGATTYDEYKKKILKDKALARRFKKIDLNEPSKEETIQILTGLRNSYQEFHGVNFPDEIIRLIVDLSDRYLLGQFFPDKAIEVMDEIGSQYRSKLKNGTTVTKEDVETLIASMANVQNITVNNDDKLVLKNLAQNIKKDLFGQDDIVDKVVQHIKLAKAGLTSKNKPLGIFGAIGSTGSGKTEFAKQLAKNLGISLLKLDMSEYSEKNSVSKLIGTSPGYVGFDQSGALTEPMIQNPYRVVLLDEIEKADPAIYDLLLQVMDEGRLTDNNNREASFRNAIILMTSNVGASRAESAKTTIGFSGESTKDTILKDELKKKFTPEFRNRFTDIFYFNDLDESVIGMIVDKEIRYLNKSLEDKRIKVIISDSAKDFLVKKAVEEKMGGRPVERLVHKYIAEKLVDKILFEGFSNTNVIFEEKDSDLISTAIL